MPDTRLDDPNRRELMDKKEYRYRKHIRWGQNVVPVFFVFLIICFWIVPLILAAFDRRVPGMVFVVLALVSLLVLVEGFFIWRLFYRMAGVSVSVGDDAIVYRHRRGVITIPFEAVTRLKFPSVKYTGGWIKIVSAENTIRLTVVIQNIGDLLQELRDALDQRGLSNCYDRKKMFSFFKTASYSDQSWARMYKIFWNLVLLTILGGVIGAFCAVFARMGIIGILLWSALSSMWPMTVFVYTEIIFARRFAKASDEGSFTCRPADHVHEKAVYQKAIVFGIAIYSVASMIAFFVAASSVS